MRKAFYPVVVAIVALAGLAGCENIDCTLNNIVLCHFAFYDSATGERVVLADTLTITAEGTDSVLLNRATNSKEVGVPLSYYQEKDILNFIIKTKDGEVYENAVIIQKTGQVHFESPDCPTTMFHNISQALVHSGTVIDSVAITRREVNYLQDENIKVFLRTRRD